jgi:hypothetical protein
MLYNKINIKIAFISTDLFQKKRVKYKYNIYISHTEYLYTTYSIDSLDPVNHHSPPKAIQCLPSDVL